MFPCCCCCYITLCMCYCTVCGLLYALDSTACMHFFCVYIDYATLVSKSTTLTIASHHRTKILRLPLFDSFLLLLQVSSFCEAQLSSYKTIFPRGSEEGGLEHVDSRFSWFRRLLSLVDNRFGKAFPPHWQLQHRLCLLFIQRTRDHLLEELSENSRPPEVQVYLYCHFHYSTDNRAGLRLVSYTAYLPSSPATYGVVLYFFCLTFYY